jgi:phosphoribosylformylglycinamidine (FGAM) synthase-like amidotransferase family enzyme
VRVAVFAPGAPLDGDVAVGPHGLAGAPSDDALRALREFASAGGRLLGLGDGVGWLCAAGLLPGRVAPRAPGVVATHVRVEGRATPFTWAIPAGRVVAHEAAALAHELVLAADEIASLASAGQVLLRYCDGAGGVLGSTSIAGVCDASGRVAGLLPPSPPTLESELGRQLLASLRGR